MPPKNGKRQNSTSTSAQKSTRISKPKALTPAALEKLRHSKRQLDIVLNAAHMGIWEWDLQTGKVDWSGEVFDIFQLSSKTFSRSFETYMNLVHPDDREHVVNSMQASMASGRNYFIHYRIVRGDGAIRWIEVYANISRGKKGQAVRMTGTIQDITEKKSIEREREDWKTRHELISSSAGLVIYDYDIDSGNIVWSGNSDTVLGYQPEELGDIHNWTLLIHPDDRAEVSTLFSKARELNRPYDVYYRFRKKDGSFCYMHDRGVFLPGADGKAARMLGMMNDVSERVQAEESLRESEQRFRILQEASFGGIGLHDKGKIIDCNQGLCNLTGYSYDELIGKNGLTLIAPEWRDFVMERILSDYDKTYDVEGVRKDGSKYFLEIRGKNMPHAGSTIRVTEFRDITNRKVAEAKMVEQNTKLFAVAEELRRKNHQLQEFTQIVSHNLRSPVGNMLALLGFYDAAENNEERGEYIALLRESATTTLMMLNELNEVLKIKQDRNIPKQELLFSLVFQKVTTMLNARITELKAEVLADFSKVDSVLYPGIYLESVMLNLLDNALKYHAPGRTPRIKFETYKNAEGNLILSVNDNGLGINLERYAHQIFKLRKTFHHHPESRGIGLFMIKSQVEAMGGEISVSSIEGSGTTFFVNFNKHQNDGQ